MKTHIESTQDKLRKGLNTAANIITSTMGGAGSTVIINQNNKLKITKDGVSVAKSIKLADPHEDVGAQLLISACDETVKATGDGTTLTALLLQQMVNNTTTREDYEKLSKEVDLLHQYIKEQTKEITSPKEVRNIAFTATNDDQIADLFLDIYTRTSLNTHVELERTDELTTTVTIDKGFRFDEGFSYNYQMTDKSRQIVQYDNPEFYVTTKPLHTVTRKIEEAISLSVKHDVPLVFIADKYSKEFNRFVQLQVQTRGAKIVTLKVPGWGEAKHHEVENIKAYLNNSSAKSIFCTPYYTLINADDSPELQERLEILQSLSNSVEDPLEARQYKSMYHRLSGNIATIWVGGKTKEDRDETYDRIEDAIGATSTATKYGYVTGCGMTFARFGSLPKTKHHNIWHAPLIKIAENAGITDFNFKSKNNKILKEDEMGLDIESGKFINLLEKGIIDPAHTLHTALNNALTNTKLVLNTKYILHNEL